MSSIYDLSGNNLPELTSTSSRREYLEVFRQLVTRKLNAYSGSEKISEGYNLAIQEIAEELDRLEARLNLSDRERAAVENLMRSAVFKVPVPAQ